MSAETLRRLVELAQLKHPKPRCDEYPENTAGPTTFVPRKKPRQRDRTFSLDGTNASKFQNLAINPPPHSASYHVRSFSQPRTNLQFLVDTVDSVLFKQPSPTRSDYDDVFDDYLSPSPDQGIVMLPLNLSPSPSNRSNCSPRLFDIFTPRNGGGTAVSSHFPPPRLSFCSTLSESASALSRPSRFTKSVRGSRPDDTIESSDIYMFDEPFGQGASAQVYKGMHVPTCTLVACKRTPSFSRHTIRQLLEECRAQLDRLPDMPQVLKLLGWYRDDATNDFVIAMEYMDLGSVFDFAFFDNDARRNGCQDEKKMTTKKMNNDNKSGSGSGSSWSCSMGRPGSGHRQIFLTSWLDWNQIRHIAKEVLLGLDAFHDRQKPLIHRDIKPQNILLSSTGEVKVADFGLVYECDGPDAICRDAKGTRKYFSPERIESQFAAAADIWAFGITMIEIAQQRLISPNILNDFKIGQDDFDPMSLMDPSKRGGEISQEGDDDWRAFVDFVGRCLRRNVVERATAAELLGDSFLIQTSCEDSFSSSSSFDGMDDENENENNHKFVDVDRDGESLETYLKWMEEWCMEDEEMNARMFLDGDDDDLMECIRSLSRVSGFDVKSIDAWISEEYRRVINAV